nr:1-acyl-sn-glycerol-3-phosphate acyltransferase [Geitlerinema calcuttense]
MVLTQHSALSTQHSAFSTLLLFAVNYQLCAMSAYRWTWLDEFCLWYPPGWLILLNRHWQHYHADPDGWNGLEYFLFLLPGGFYLAVLIRWLRLGCRLPRQHLTEFDPNYQQAFRDEVLSAIAQRYFRAQLHQSEHLPQTGPLIIAMNHAGMCFPWDFLNLAYLLGQERNWQVHPLAEVSLFEHPWVIWWLPVGWSQVLGGVQAKPEDFEAAVAHQTILLYAPEGLRGPQKGWLQRYQLQTFHPSFVQLSDRYQIPILPVICQGSEFLHPWTLNIQPLANLFQLPFLPVSLLMLAFLLFPSMGVWAMRSRLQYSIQPPEPPESLPKNRTNAYRRAQNLREKLQNQLLSCKETGKISSDPKSKVKLF